MAEPTTAQLEAQAAEIRGILQRGAKKIIADGVTTEYDFDELRRQLSAIESTLTPTKRPRVMQINLGGF